MAGTGDATRVFGRRHVSGVTGLVRYHCETVMSSMVATSLDTVDTQLRRDLVSVRVYVRYHGHLANMLASFTDTLTVMLSGKQGVPRIRYTGMELYWDTLYV